MYVRLWQYEMYVEKVPLQEQLIILDTFEGGIIVVVFWFMFVINKVKTRL